MSVPSESPQSASATSSSDTSTCELACHFFACGHGDTILLELSGGKWALVDCHLTKSDGTYDRFFEFLEDRRIERLEFIVISHPDIDHFLGMEDVLRYFVEKKKGVGYWIDSGFNGQQMKALLDEAAYKRYGRLYDLWDEYVVQKKIVDYASVNDNSEEFSHQGVSFIPIAPSPTGVVRYLREAGRVIAAESTTQLEANALSVVLVLSAVAGSKRFQLFLGADPITSALETAIDAWIKRAASTSRPKEFHVVKIPHHGSPHSHCPRLCSLRSTQEKESVAVVSSGNRNGLPDRQVLHDYITHKWTVTNTNVRRRKPIPSCFFQLSNSPTRNQPAHGAMDIRVHWSDVAGLSFSPAESEVGLAELSAY